MKPFLDRREAGRQLALRLAEYAKRPDVTILAARRGGVPVAFEVARVLDAPLDLLIINNGSAPDLSGRTVIVIADGIMTGTSMRVAVATLRARGAASVIVAAPVVAPNAFAELATVADACVAVATPEPFDSIGVWYSDTAPVTDAVVLFLLERAALNRTSRAA